MTEFLTEGTTEISNKASPPIYSRARRSVFEELALLDVDDVQPEAIRTDNTNLGLVIKVGHGRCMEEVLIPWPAIERFRSNNRDLVAISTKDLMSRLVGRLILEAEKE